MDAAVLVEHREPLEVRSVESPTVDSDGVVIDVEACGVCRSDWHGWVGDWEWLGIQTAPGQILGHEPAGTVIEVGEDVSSVREGDHVAVPFNLGDGTCPECRQGFSNTCENITPLGFVQDAQGAFASELHVPSADHNAVRLPAGVSSTDMAGLGCRFMTAFHALAHRATVAAGDWLVVHGCGGVGLSAVHIGSVLGANVVAVDVMEEKLAKARELGAVETINAETVDGVAREVKGVTDGGADVSVDALGITETCQQSIRCLGNRGEHVQIGLTTQEEEGEIAVPTDLMVMREIEFIGSLGMPPTRYGEIFSLVETGKLRPSAIVSETIGLGGVNAVLREMTTYQTVGIPVITSF